MAGSTFGSWAKDFLGLAREDEMYEQELEAWDDEPATAEAKPQPAASAAPAAAAPRAAEEPAERQRTAPVTPINRNAPAPVPTPAAANMSEILTVRAKAFNDAHEIGTSFRDGLPVVIDTTEMSDGDARRLIDFVSGCALALEGKLDRVTNRVFILSPKHINVHREDKQAAADRAESFFA